MYPASFDLSMKLFHIQRSIWTLTFGGLPPHTLNIKVGAPAMLLANTDPARGHCNGTRYIVRHITAHIAYSMRRIFRRCWVNQFLRTGPRGNCTSWCCVFTQLMYSASLQMEIDRGEHDVVHTRRVLSVDLKAIRCRIQTLPWLPRTDHSSTLAALQSMTPACV